MVRLTIIGATAIMAVAPVSAVYEPPPDGATWLPPTKYCKDNPPIIYIPFTPDGQVPPEAIPAPGDCEPAIVFCGLNPNSTQRVDWCGSSTGMPVGMGWSNNVGYAMTTSCALGSRYSDCDLDNENGRDIGSVVVSVADQTFTVSVNSQYEISEYNIQVGSGLNKAATNDFASYQTKGESLADGEAVISKESFTSADWFVMRVMYCPASTPDAIPDPIPDPIPEEPHVDPEPPVEDPDPVPAPPTVECVEEVGMCWSTTGGFLNQGIQATSKSYTFGGNVGPHGNWEVVDHMTGDNFHSNNVMVVECLKVPGVTGPSPGGPKLEQNMLKFQGTGSLRDGVTGDVVEGLYFHGCVIDAGEPAGKGQNDHDYFEIVVCPPDSTTCQGSGLCAAHTLASQLLTPAPQNACNSLTGTVFAACGNLDGGNVQLHPQKKDNSGGDCDIPIPGVIPTLPDEVPEITPPSCDPVATVQSCPDGQYNMFWAKTFTSTTFEDSPGYGHCINKDSAYTPEGFNGPITKVDGADYFEVDGSTNSDIIQKFKFKASAGTCFVLEGSHKASTNCFGANMRDCQGIEFYAQEAVAPQQNPGKTQDISHGEIIFACCGPPTAIPPPPLVIKPPPVPANAAAPTSAPTAAEPEDLVIPREDTANDGVWDPESPSLPLVIPCDPTDALEVCGGKYHLYWAKTVSETSWASSPGAGHCINKHATDIPTGFTGPIYKVDASNYLEPTFKNSLTNQKFQFKVDNCFIIDGAHKAGQNCFDDTKNGEDCRNVEFYAQVAAPGQHQAGKKQEISHGELIFACCGALRADAVAQTWTTGGGGMTRRTQAERKSAYW